MAHLLIKDTVLSDRRLPLPGRVVVLGRSLDVDVPIPHVSVSRRHALIEMQDGGFLLSDLGSSNGTFVGEGRIPEGERREIAFGAPFRVGEVVFRIAADETLGGSPAAPAVKVGTVNVPTVNVPTVNVRAAPKTRPAPAATAKTRAKPSHAQRAGIRREREQAMRWLGIIVTIALVSLAGVFLAKIVGKTGSDEAAVGAPADETGNGAGEKPGDYEITPLKPRGEQAPVDPR
ncbi:MAG: FHA domain-containing protein [Planctomycetota bacterium]